MARYRTVVRYRTSGCRVQFVVPIGDLNQSNVVLKCYDHKGRFMIGANHQPVIVSEPVIYLFEAVLAPLGFKPLQEPQDAGREVRAVGAPGSSRQRYTLGCEAVGTEGVDAVAFHPIALVLRSLATHWTS